MIWKLAPLVLLASLALVPAAEEPKPAPFFNEKDLTGWHNSNCAADTFSVKDKELITTGKPIGILHTDKQYENFELEVEWMHINKKEVGNSGIFLWCDSLPAVGTPFTRGIEVQVLVNYPDVGWATNHGDIFSIWGAKCKPDRPHPKGYERCLPSENRAKGGGEWNHYKIVANDGTIKLSVNGKEVSGRQRVLAAEGIHRHRERGGGVPLPQLQVQGTAEYEPETGGDRHRTQWARQLVRPRFHGQMALQAGNVGRARRNAGL